MRAPKTAFLVILIVASILVAASLWKRAFPIAAVDFALSQTEVRARMDAFLESVGAHPRGDDSVVTFGESSEDKNFVELEYGARRLEELGRSGLAVWYWAGRWFRPERLEESGVWLSPRGDLVGYWRTIDDAEKIPSLAPAPARALAERFLREHAAQHPAGRLEFTGDSFERRPNRVDYTFTWERRDLRLGAAPYELTVTVQGDTVGGYGEGLTVPDWWRRKFARQRQVNELCEQIATYALMALLVGLLVVFVRALARGDVRWRGAAPWVWPVAFGLVELAAQLNALPSALFDYDTTQSWSAFLGAYGFDALRAILAAAAGAWLLLVMIDPIYRARFPGAPSLSGVLGPDALRRSTTVRALGAGIVAAVVSLAYVSFFYVVSRHFGAWCPVDIDASKTLSGWLPWIESMQVGLSAAFDEELLFRVAAILLIWRVVRVRWVAVVLAAMLWAFLHSNYPQQPGYIRGVELTIVGIAWGALFLRYGLVATLTAHYLYDCWLGGFVVFASGSPGNQIGAVAVSAWPIVLWAWLARRRLAGGPEPLAEPETIVVRPPAVGREPLSLPAPLRLGGRSAAAILSGIALALAAMHWIPQKQAAFRKFGKLDFSREAISLAADRILRERGQDPARFRRVVTSGSAGVPSPAYLLEFGSLDRLAGLFQANWPDVTWHVRYFRVLEPEEFHLVLDKSGRLLDWRRDIPREAPGASLDRAAARAVAERALAQDGVRLDREKLVSDDLTPEAKRRDYRLVFERKDFDWGEARLRTAIRVQGDEPEGFSRSIRVPEKWTRDNQKSGWQKLVTGELKSWTLLAIGLAVVIALGLLIRRGHIPWRTAFLIALYKPALDLAGMLNELPWFFSGYSTTESLAHHYFTSISGDIVRLIFGYLGAAVRVGVALGLVRWVFGVGLRDLAPGFPSARERRRWLAQTLLLAAASVTAFAALDFLRQTVAGHLLPAGAVHFSFPDVNESLPWLGILTGSISAGIDGVLRVAMVVAVLGLVVRRFPRASWALLFAYPLLTASGQQSGTEFWFTLVFEELELGLMVLLVTRVWRADIGLVFAAYALSHLLFLLLPLWLKGGPAYQWQILPPLVALAVVVAGVAWARIPARPS